ncbi:peptidoglycan-binding domain-containing protein [Streptomyces justiciae]|uniref:Peptidoglycan-binding domain-containing protein n=1 Tax=Streptomyces justiciae TaxID=2780140 RepID=A0ABU3LSJ6_9ACTN|nr:peptidoglycan-binding domain-containing protein [Streptomyces justiciae]MDT7842202.1 peptidoglycan-binding domain-containing protein [Streptomyces justiciae]
MSTSPEPGEPDDRPVLEPIRVLRPRRTDALAELMKDMPARTTGFESVVMPRRPSGDEDLGAADFGAEDFSAEGATEELPPVRGRFDVGSHGSRRPVGRGDGFGFGPGLRRAAIVVAVSAAALVGFGCALLLPGRADGTAAPAPSPAPSTPPATPTAPATTDPDGAGTLREGDSGPEVTDLQQRLLRIPNVYENGSTNGTYDPGLTEAVARFQLWYGIRGDETGVYGDDTRRDLESRTTTGGG